MTAPQLWNLLDMLAQNAKGYLLLGERLNEIRTTFDFIDAADPGSPQKAIRPAEMAVLQGEMKSLGDLCTALDLPVTKHLLGEVGAPNTGGEFDILVKAFYAEIASKVLLFVPSPQCAFYEKDDLLTEPARVAFPTGTAELRQAANAYALALPTACVFHCMRALEHGLRALATDVGKTFDVQNWQNIIDEIGSAVVELGKTLPRGAAKSERLQFLSETVKEFMYFKDGWRNYVSHGRAPYTEQQALTVLSHTRDFLENLSSRLRE